MRNPHRIGSFGLIMMAGSLWACGEESVGPAPSEITGTWQATQDEYVSKTSTARVDVVAEGGTAVLVLGSNHSLELTETPASGTPYVLQGTWELTTDILKVAPAGATWYWAWDVSLSGNTLRLTGADRLFDCDRNGVPEESDWNLVLTR